jgi:uncharacterized protein YndB with AHSA1/START domain
VLSKIVIGLAAALVVVAVVVARQPSRYRVARSVEIGAPPERVFALVNDLRRWEAWSPWLKADPGARTAYEGASAGPGAAFTWSGNREVGEGRMTITESHPSDLVRLRLDFLRPFKSTAAAEFTFAPSGRGTVASWSMSGEKNFAAKALHMVVNMDKMIGGKFDEGLAQMKAIAESSARH